MNKIQKLIELCTEKNIPLVSLIRRDFLPGDEDVAILLSEISKEPKHDCFKLLEILKQHLKCESTRIARYYLWNIAVEQKKNLVFEIFHELKNKIDENGLITVPYNADLNKDGFKYKNKYLIFDKFFKRNFHFTEWLIKNWKDDFNLKVPIDKDLLGMPETRREFSLLSHWHGPSSLEVIKKLKTESFVIKGPSTFNAPLLIDKTEFYFSPRENQWFLEIEELIPIQGFYWEELVDFQGTTHRFYTKYLHAIVDNDLKCCYHIDGAIRVYDTYENFKRRNYSTLNKESKSHSKRLKVFQIDSVKGINSFHEIIGLFFDGNPYVLEIFEGETNFSNEVALTRTKILEFDLKRKNYS